MAESPAQPPMPWLYPYREDPQETRRQGEPVLRPFVCVSLANGEKHTALLDGLIASGSDGVIASALLADQLGIDLSDNEGEFVHSVSGRPVKARQKTLSLRLHPPDACKDVFIQWQTQIGFVEKWHGFVTLGNVGFFDHFKVTVGGSSQAVAIEQPSPLELIGTASQSW
jgi:hypothetical protein